VVTGIREMPSGYDEQTAQLFRQMRAATGLSLEHMARRLGTTPRILSLFECGAMLALPEWQETQRIVGNYGRLVGVDVSPLLSRIYAQGPFRPLPSSNKRQPAPQATPMTDASITSISMRPPMPRLPAAPRHTSTHVASRSNRPKPRRRYRAFLAILLPMLVIGGVFLAGRHANALQTAARGLPEPITAYAQAGVELVLAGSSTIYKHLRRMDTGDPQARKSDKLQVRASSE
jgi:transcriptional regulator with XRE-family HTH domain